MNNMYKLSIKQWNPFAGCKYNCIYCKPSFQAQLKRWAKHNCQKCYNYAPHLHPEKIGQRLPNTRYMQFIFCCANGDITFCPTHELEMIINRIMLSPFKTFLIQSKNPKTFERVSFPRNVILGTTIETNKEYFGKVPHHYFQISSAPIPYKRWSDFCEVKHMLKMATIEPVLDFDLDVMVKWMIKLNPLMIWLGFNSKKTPKLPEPPLEKVKQLHWELSKRGFTVMLKTIRKAWYE